MKNGWESKKLGDVCSFLNRGVSPKYVEKGGIVVINQRCIREHRVNFEMARRHDIKAKGVGAERLVQAGDVLVNSTGEGTLGRVAQLRDATTEPTTVDSHVTIVRPLPGVFFTEFFGYVLRDIEEELKQSGEGCGGQTELNRSVLAERFVVRFPKSLAEQQRIVGVLDEAFAGFATAQANAETNLRNARALFETHLQSVFSQRSKGWVEKTLEEVVNAQCTLSYGIVQPGQEYPNGMPVVRPTDLTAKTITLDGLKRIEPKLADSYRRTTLRGGELLLCVRGSTGVISMTAPELAGANVTRGIVPIVFAPSLVRQDFGFFLMTSEAIQRQIRAKTYGAALMQINIGELRKLTVSFPSLIEQERMAVTLHALSTETQCLESLYQQKLAALAALKKSLLHQAFSGDL